MSKGKGGSDLLHQKEELDILESIYMDELELHSAMPPYKFSVQCRPYMDFSLDEALERFAINLDIELSKNYPNEVPKCEIKHHVDKISHSDLQQVHKIIQRTAEEMKGTPMLFELIESIRNWLQNNIVDPELRPKKLKRRNPNDEFGLDEDFEEHEIVINLTKKETYTAVTRDSFLEWKARFDEEMEALKIQKATTQKEEKLSGKQLFERDMKLITSDALDKDEDVEDTELDAYADEEAKQEEEDEERAKKLFYYNEDLFEGDVDIDDDS